MRKHKALPILSGVITSIIFGLSFLFSKMALAIASPFELLSFRFLTAFLIMSALIVLKIIPINYKDKNIKGLILLGLMQPIVYFIFESYGIMFSSSSQAGLMIALIPICVSIMSTYLLHERPTALQIFYIILSVGGVMFIIIMSGLSSENSTILGTILLLGAVISASIFNILSRKLSLEFTPMELTYSMMGLGTIFFNFVSISNHIINKDIKNYFSPLYNGSFLISIGYLGILSSIIAFFLINYTLSKIEASKSAVLANISTIVSIFAGVIFLKETFKYYHIIGSFMILIGIWGTNYYGIKRTSAVESSQTI